MFRIFVALVVLAAILLAATALAGTTIQTRAVHVWTLLGPERGALRLVP